MCALGIYLIIIKCLVLAVNFMLDTHKKVGATVADDLAATSQFPGKRLDSPSEPEYHVMTERKEICQTF